MRAIGALSAVVLASAVGAQAQAQVAGAGCPAEQTVGSLGVSLIECDCVIAPAVSSTPWRFWTEPRVLRIERGSAASYRLQVGDVITHVNGLPVTTEAGARALARVQPNQTVSLRIRRGEQTLEQSLQSAAVCSNDPVLLGATPAIPPALANERERVVADVSRTAQAAVTSAVTPQAVTARAVTPGEATTTAAQVEAVSAAAKERAAATTVRPGGGAVAAPKPAGGR